VHIALPDGQVHWFDGDTDTARDSQRGEGVLLEEDVADVAEQNLRKRRVVEPCVLEVPPKEGEAVQIGGSMRR